MFTHPEQTGCVSIGLNSLKIPRVSQGYVSKDLNSLRNVLLSVIVVSANPFCRYLIAFWWFCKHLFCLIILLHSPKKIKQFSRHL